MSGSHRHTTGLLVRVMAAAGAVAFVGIFAAGASERTELAGVVAFDGDVSLTTDAAGSAIFEASNLAPATPVTNCLAVAYVGDAPIDLGLHADDDGGPLAEHLRLQIDAGTGGAHGDCDGFSGSNRFDGTLATFLAVHGDTSRALAVPAPSSGGSTTFRFTVTLDPHPQAQGRTTTSSYTWTAIPRPADPPATTDPTPDPPMTTDPTPDAPSTPDPTPDAPSTPDPTPGAPSTPDPTPGAPSTPDPTPEAPSAPEPAPDEPPASTAVPDTSEGDRIEPPSAAPVDPSPADSPRPTDGTAADDDGTPRPDGPHDPGGSPPDQPVDGDGETRTDGPVAGAPQDAATAAEADRSSRSRIEEFVEKALVIAQEVAERSRFPLLLFFVVLLFLVIQDRIDRTDPKLAEAPREGDLDLHFEPPPSQRRGSP